MANNRMYLRCVGCGAEFCLAKYYPSSGWFTGRKGNDEFNQWLEDHRHADGPLIDPVRGFMAPWEPGRRHGSMWGDECFVLEYEIREDPVLKPLGNRVLLGRMAPEKAASSMIVIPDSAERPSQRFKVLAVGPGRVVDGVRTPMDVKEGDVVLLGRYAGAEVEVGGVPMFVAEVDEIMAVVG